MPPLVIRLAVGGELSETALSGRIEPSEGSSEVRMIESIEELAAQFEVDILTELEFLGDIHVQVPDWIGAAPGNVAGCVPSYLVTRVGECCPIQIGALAMNNIAGT